MKNYTYIEKNCKKIKLFFSIVMLAAAMIHISAFSHNSSTLIFAIIEMLIAIGLIIMCVCVNKSLVAFYSLLLNCNLFFVIFYHLYYMISEHGVQIVHFFGFEMILTDILALLMPLSAVFTILFKFKRYRIIKLIASALSISYIMISCIRMYNDWDIFVLNGFFAEMRGPMLVLSVILSVAPIWLISSTYKKINTANIKADENINAKVGAKPIIDNIPEQIKEYKELLDMEIITQGEYDKKKSELLNK